jgi:hypothetical protein
MTRDETYNRLRRVRDELQATRYALGRAEAKWDTEAGRAPAKFRGEVTLDEIRRAAANLERTFVMRLFAEFEGVLLDFWEHGLGRTTEPRAVDLIDAIAAGCPSPIGNTHRDDVHHVRRYRNRLVHPRADRTDPLTVDQCLSRLGKYLAYFPPRW